MVRASAFRRIALLLGALMLIAPTALLAQQRDGGIIEIAPYSGGTFSSTTFEDPETPNEGLTIRSALVGVDVSYFSIERFGFAVMVTRQTVSIGPVSERTSLAATAAGALIKYRWPISSRTTFIVSGGAGVTHQRLDTGVSQPASTNDAPSTSRSHGPFALAGTGMAVSAGEHVGIEMQVRRIFNRLSVDDEPSARYVGGLMITFGATLRLP